MQGNAVDYGGYNQNALASWMMKHSAYLLELIHTTDSGGYYVKNGKVVGPYAASGHHDHVHIAITLENVKKLLEGVAITGVGSGSGGSTSGSGSGGAIPNPLQPLLDLLEAGKNFFMALADPYTWKRLALIGIGLGLLLVGALTFLPATMKSKVVNEAASVTRKVL
jgi:hypothetical protein